MRKVLMLLCTAFLLLGIATAESSVQEIDFSSLTDDEINEYISLARQELVKRKAHLDGDELLFSEYGLTCYLTGNMRLSGTDFLYVEVLVINESDVALAFTNSQSTVNGWQSFVNGMGTISAKSQALGEIQFNIKKIDSISTVDDVEQFSVSLDILDKDNTKTLGDTELVTITVK